MRMISANKLNRLWKNGVVAKMVAKTKVLKTVEEIAANTNVENVAGATAVKELSNNLTSKMPGQLKLIAEGSGADVKYYAQLGADTASKKPLGSSMYKCPDRWQIASKTVGYARNNLMFILTFGKNIKISASTAQFDFKNAYWVFLGIPVDNSEFAAVFVPPDVAAPYKLSINSDGVIVDSGKYKAVMLYLGVSGNVVLNNINIEWV
jgi:hypothetical protein